MANQSGTPSSIGRGRNRNPTSLFAYQTLGNPTTITVAGIGNSRSQPARKMGSVTSKSSSVSSRIRKQTLEAKEQVLALTVEFNKQSRVLRKEIRDIERRLSEAKARLEELGPSQTGNESVEVVSQRKANSALERKLKEKIEDLDTLKADLETDKQAVLEKYQIQKEWSTLEEELDEDFDSEEEQILNNFCFQDDREIEKNSCEQTNKLDNELLQLQLKQVGLTEETEKPHSTQQAKSYQKKMEELQREEALLRARFEDLQKERVIQDSQSANNMESLQSQPQQKDVDVLQQLTTAFTRALDSRPTSEHVVTKYVEKELPIFSGKAEEWLPFKCEYDRTTSKYKFDDSENMTRLRKCLKGTAKEHVQHLMTNPSNVYRILELLETLFGRAEHVLETITNKVAKMNSPDVNKPETIVEFALAIDSLVTNMVSYNKPEYLNDSRLFTDLVKKLPPLKVHEWSIWQSTNRKPRNLLSFNEWLRIHLSYTTQYVQLKVKEEEGDRKDKKEDRRDRRRQGGVHAASQSEKPCLMECKDEVHPIWNCPKFRALAVAERRKKAKSFRLCYQCLSGNHLMEKCKSKIKCRKDGCKGKHNPLLHEDRAPAEEKESSPPEAEDGEIDQAITTCGKADNLPIIKILVEGPNGKEPIYALFDSGASFSMVEESVARRLGADGKKSALTFTVFGGKRQVKSKEVDLRVGAFSQKGKKGKMYSVKSVNTIPKLNLPRRNFDAEAFKAKYPHLKDMEVLSMKNAQPQMVLGINVGTLFAAREILEFSPGQTPAAIRSLLGWYAVYDQEDVRKQFQFVCDMKRKDEQTQGLVEDFFKLESVGIKVQESTRSIEDKVALAILEKTTIKGIERWETGLLWKDENASMPDSKQMALNRLHSMERKMDKNENMGKLCVEKFEDYIKKGYLSEVSVLKEDDRKFYLPWFFAYHPSKKPRLVFDAAAKVKGKSFNDFLWKGPDLICNLAEVLARFRIHQIALVGDIKEMFHQVLLKESDRPSQTILYRGMERSSPPKEYEMQRLFFGSASSPCSAIFTRNKNAEDYRKEFPQAVISIQRDMYVDDLLGGGETEEEVIQLRKDMNIIMDSGGFPLLKWNSSSSAVLKSIPENLRATTTMKVVREGCDVQMEKTLGISWMTHSDEFVFKFKGRKFAEDLMTGNSVPTKREVISLVMSVFDPLGFLAPLKMKALAIIQQLWRSHRDIDWDEKIPISIMGDWRNWLQELTLVEELKIPRRYSTVKKQRSSFQLHVFCDASLQAYAAAAYLRINTGGSVSLAFVVGKARVSPVKGFASIPRGELQAALIASRLSVFVNNAFQQELKIESTTLWSDSKTVLCWIRSTRQRFKAYVSNRVNEILENSNVSDWRWVPTADNVADDGTRPEKPVNYENYRWLQGPDFLLQEPDEWPVETKVQPKSEDLEELPQVCTIVRSENWWEKSNLEEILPAVERFSNWMRLVRATAYVVSAKELMRGKIKLSKSKVLTSEHIRIAIVLLQLRSQMNSFAAEHKDLKHGRPLSGKSKLKNLGVFLNEDGLICIEGRINLAQYPNKNPPVLDTKDPYTKLMVEFYHRKGAHFGKELLVNDLQENVWILNIRVAVKSCINKCLVCKRARAKPQPPQMGQLPLARVQSERPVFYYTGTDYYGPLLVKNGRKTEKRWGVIFSCLTTRAVHLDLADNLDTNSMIEALIRFINLRGRPAEIWSDNGTNFVGADRTMRAALQELDQQEITDRLQVKGIKWNFIPPASPFMGGSWERMIRSVKRILGSLLKEQQPRESTLRTLLTEVTGILNSRPLTLVSSDHNDPAPLTPNDLLHIPCIKGPTIPGTYDEDTRFRKSWRYVQYLADEFWRRWRKEYLPTLIKRQKWHQKQDPLKPGDVVVVMEDTEVRNHWKIGLVLETFPGKDGQTRSAEVRITSVDPTDKRKQVKVSTLRRPTMKLFRLLINVSAPEEAGRKNVAEHEESLIEGSVEEQLL